MPCAPFRFSSGARWEALAGVEQQQQQRRPQRHATGRRRRTRAMLRQVLHGALRAAFRTLGRAVASHPVFFLSGPALLAVLLGASFSRYRVERDVQGLMAPRHSLAKMEGHLVDSLFPVNRSKHALYADLQSPGRYGRVIITARRGSVLDPQHLDTVLKLHRLVYQMQVTVASSPSGLGSFNYSLSHLCLPDERNQCLVDDIIRAMEEVQRARRANRTAPAVRYPITQLADGRQAYIGHQLGGVQGWGGGAKGGQGGGGGGASSNNNNNKVEAVRSARALQLTYYLQARAGLMDRVAGQWEEAFCGALRRFAAEHRARLALYPVTSASLRSDFQLSSVLARRPLLASLGACGLLAVACCSMRDCVRSKPWLGPLALLNVTLSGLTAAGILNLTGATYNSTYLGIPFIMLGHGLFGSFEMLSSWRRTREEHHVKERVAATYEEAGLRLTGSTALHLAALGLAASPLTNMEAVRLFCRTAALGVLVGYLYTLSFYGSCLVFTGYLETGYRHGCFCRRVRPPPTATPGGGPNDHVPPRPAWYRCLMYTRYQDETPAPRPPPHPHAAPPNAPPAHHGYGPPGGAAQRPGGGGGGGGGSHHHHHHIGGGHHESNNNNTDPPCYASSSPGLVARPSYSSGPPGLVGRPPEDGCCYSTTSPGLVGRPPDSHLLLGCVQHCYGDWITNTYVKPFVVLLYLVYVSFGLMGFLQVRQGADPSALVAMDTATVLYARAQQRYFSSYSPVIGFYIYESAPYWNASVQRDLLEYAKGFQRISWLESYLGYLSERNQSSAQPRRNFTRTLRRDFLRDRRYAHFADDIIFAERPPPPPPGIGGGKRAEEGEEEEEEEPDVAASRVFLVARTTENKREEMSVLLDTLRRLSLTSRIRFLIFNPSFVYLDRYAAAVSWPLRHSLLAVLFLLALASLTVMEPLAAAWLAASLLSVQFGVLGFMTLWGAELDCASALCLLSAALGGTADCCAPLLCAFAAGRGDTRTRWVRAALEQHGVPALQALLCYAAALAPLAAVRSQLTWTMFRCLVLSAGCAALHALAFLPALLTFLPPAKKTSTSPAHHHRGENGEEEEGEEDGEGDGPAVTATTTGGRGRGQEVECVEMSGSDGTRVVDQITTV